MRKILRDGIVAGFLDEANKITSKDSFLLDLNETGVPLVVVSRQGRATTVKIDESQRVFPRSGDYVISLKRYLEQNGYVLQLMGDML